MKTSHLVDYQSMSEAVGKRGEGGGGICYRDTSAIVEGMIVQDCRAAAANAWL